MIKKGSKILPKKKKKNKRKLDYSVKGKVGEGAEKHPRVHDGQNL